MAPNTHQHSLTRSELPPGAFDVSTIRTLAVISQQGHELSSDSHDAVALLRLLAPETEIHSLIRIGTTWSDESKYEFLRSNERPRAQSRNHRHLTDFDLIYVAPEALLWSDFGANEKLLAELAEAREGGTIVVSALHGRTPLSDNIEASTDATDELIALSDIVLASLDDQREVEPTITALALVDTLESRGVKEVVVRDMAGGKCTIYDGRTFTIGVEIMTQPGEALSLTGHFNGSYLAGRLRRRSPQIASYDASRMAGVIEVRERQTLQS